MKVPRPTSLPVASLLSLFVMVLALTPADAGPAAAADEPVAPVLAWYYPQFSQGLQTDLRNAAAAKIDGLIVSETGARDLGGHLAVARGTGVHVTIGVEPQTYPTPDALAQRLRNALAVDAADPSFLRYQGKPVLVFWRPPDVPVYSGQSPQSTWQTLRSKVDPGRTSIWIAEGGDPNSTLSYLPAFDGLHLYSIAWAADPAGQLANWANRLRGYDAAKLWVATVMPGGYYGNGFDVSQWQYRDRANGEYYRAAWRGAIATNPAMVIITSYNETRERTEIQPTAGWGTLYVDITREMGDAWRARFPLPLPTSETFPETGQTVRGPFFAFFNRFGGLDRFGYPITGELNDGGRTVQLFQRARMEHYPELAGTPWEVQLTLLGDILTAAQQPFLAGEQFADSPDHRFFWETGHGVHNAFLRFFDTWGGLESFGYPISEELEQGGLTAQYFQRARFEHHPQHAGTPYDVQLGLLGEQYLALQATTTMVAQAPRTEAVLPAAQAAPTPATPTKKRR